MAAIDKLNIFSQPSALTSTNPINASIKGVSTGGSSGGSPTGGSQLFAGRTEGINDKITGTIVFAGAQAGKQAGVLGSAFQAIA